MSDETYVDEAGRFTMKREYGSQWTITLTGETFQNALIYDDEQHKEDTIKKKGWYLRSPEFEACMKKYGFERYDSEDYPIDPIYTGYAIFPGDKEKEIWVKLAFRDFQEIDGDHSIELSPYHYDDEEYNNERLEIYWNVIGAGLHDAMVAYLNDEDCSGERAKEAAKEKQRKMLQAKENALAAEYQAKKNITRKLKENRKTKLLSLRNRFVANQSKKNNKLPNNNNYYESNAEYTVPNLKNTTLLSKLNYNSPVSHAFLVAVKDSAHIHAVDESERIPYSELNEAVLLPAMSLSAEQFLCKGIVASGYLKDSILRSDIVVALVEPAEEKNDSYFVGLATLVVKEDALEIDVICTQIGYKLAGKLLMNKVITISTKLGKSKIELLSVKNPETVAFYKRLLFKKVAPNNNFAKQGTRKGLIAFRRRTTRKKSNSNEPAGGAGASGAAAGAGKN